jgi:hypothetical protein
MRIVQFYKWLVPQNDSNTKMQDSVAEQFVPTKDFFSDEMGSQYVKGLPYTVRKGNTRLHEVAHKWEQQGLVTFTNLTGKRLTGKGRV